MRLYADIMDAFQAYTHRDLQACTPRQLIALLQQAGRIRQRRFRLGIAAATRARWLAQAEDGANELARLERED